MLCLTLCLSCFADLAPFAALAAYLLWCHQAQAWHRALEVSPWRS